MSRDVVCHVGPFSPDNLYLHPTREYKGMVRLKVPCRNSIKTMYILCNIIAKHVEVHLVRCYPYNFS